MWEPGHFENRGQAYFLKGEEVSKDKTSVEKYVCCTTDWGLTNK